MAATKVRPEDVNFMARYGRGLICLTLTRQRCEQLRLPLMVSNTDQRKTTNFTVSIEAAEGVTTGISAHDRARLAGLEPAAVIVEILNDDGAMARRDDLLRFARRHKLKIGTIADLIEYRLRTEESVEVISDQPIATQFGAFRMVCFEDHVNRAVHIALVRGTIDARTPTLVRVHRQDTLGDVIGVRDPTLHRPLQDALQLIADHENGVVVLLRPEESARDLMKAVGALGRAAEPAPRSDRAADFRTFGIGAQILRALGVRRMRVLGAPRHLHALSGFGLEIVEYLSAEDAARENSNG